MPNKFTVLDIETQPQPVDRLREIMPAFKADARLKDETKIKEDLAAKESDWLDSAALHAVRGEVLCAGLLQDKTFTVLEGPERDIVEKLMAVILTQWGQSVIVGHNIFQFDLPFICRRALKHGIAIPQFLTKALRGYYPPYEIFDTMLEWRLSNREERISLDTLAWHLGVGRKTGSGADFAKLYQTDKAAALLYLSNDLSLCKSIYERTGL